MDIPFFKKLSLDKGLDFFKKKEDSILGIDLGSSSFKIVQLRKQKERAVLETYGELASGPYAEAEVGKSVRLTNQKVAEMLGDLVKESSATSRKAVVGIPLRSSFVTLISMPFMSEQELQEAVPYEARRYIPVPLSEVIIDWWPLPQGMTVSENKEEGFAKERKFLEVLLVAIHRETVEKYQSIFREAGIEIASFEIEIFSQVRSILAREISPMLLVDLGSQSTKFTVIDYGVVRISHSLEQGAQSLTQALSRSLGVDFERAEKLKRDTGLSSRPEHQEVVRVIQPLVEYIFSEGMRVASEYRRRHNRAIKKVILTGGGANIAGVIDASTNKFGVESRLANPFGKVEYPAFLEPMLKELGPSFSTAIGLALRELQEG